VLVAIAIGLVVTVATSGLALVPIVLGVALFEVLRRRQRNHQPRYQAEQLIKRAMLAADPAAVGLLHEAIDIDPSGKDTLIACANWFYDRQCWADAADAYAGYLHVEATPFYEIRQAESLVRAGHLDEAVAELGHLRTEGLTESDQALVLSDLAMTFALKGDPGQGLAFANEAGLQKHALSPGAQRCLMMRAICRYLTGQKARGIDDLERLYAINSSPEVLELKARMQNGTYQLDVPNAYPAWYPAKVELREGPVVEEVPDGHSEVLALGAASPDGKWRWSGSEWNPIVETEPRHA
jgi:hypothetical protein